MSWIKLDDRCPRHPKVANLSDRAFRCWVEAMCYANEFLTDGLLPRGFISTVPAAARTELVKARLWVVESGETRIHGYLDHQTSRAYIEQERERNRKRRTGGVPASYRRGTGGTTGGVPGKNRDQKEEGRIQKEERTKALAPSARFQSSAPTAQERAAYRLWSNAVASAGFGMTLTEWVSRQRGA